MLYEADEPFLVHRVEERADVGVQYEVHLSFDPDHERIHRIMRAAPRPERKPEEVFLVDRVEIAGLPGARPCRGRLLRFRPCPLFWLS